MNAATSPYGVLCDIPIIFVLAAALGVLAVAVYSSYPGVPLWGAVGFVCLPMAVSVVAHIALRNARGRVVAWLRTIPFPIENLNAVLSGSGEYFEIFLRDACPTREVVMEFLEKASEDAFVLEQDADRKVISARFGVVDSKLNPYRTAFLRYERMRRVVDMALVPMHGEHPIERVLIV